MSHFANVLLDLVGLDGQARRAIDETLADWRHEAQEATTLTRRVFVAVRGCLALSGAIARVTMGELRQPELWGSLAVVFGVAVGLGVPLVVPRVLDYGSVLELSPSTTLKLLMLLLPQALGLTLALALLTPLVLRSCRMSILAMALLVITGSALNLGWGIPQANRELRETLWVLSGQPAEKFHLGYPMRMAEMTVDELGLTARDGTWGVRRNAVRALSERASLVVLAPAFLFLGVQAHRFVARRRWRLPAGVLAWVVAVGTYVLGNLASSELRAADSLTFAELGRRLALWPCVVAALVAALLLALGAQAPIGRSRSSS